MHIEIINEKRYSAERVFLCNWMELCGYMVIGRDYALDLPVDMQNIEYEGQKTGIRIGRAHDRIVIEVRQELLINGKEDYLKFLLVQMMEFIDKEEDEEESLYYGYQDRRSKWIDKIAEIYIRYRVYLHIFILNRTYTTSHILLPSEKEIHKCIDIVEHWNQEQDVFLEFVAVFLHSRLRKAQKFLRHISWTESEQLLERCDFLLRKMKMSHYQDTLYLIKSHIYETVPGESNNVWANLRQIRNRHYYVTYKLGALREKSWKNEEEAKQFYQISRIIMPEYFRADYKLAYLYEAQECFELAERLYKQVIAKVWFMPKSIWSREDLKDVYDTGLIKPDMAVNLTMLDVEYLLKTWNRLLKTLKKNFDAEKRSEAEKEQIKGRYKSCFQAAELNYKYMEDGIRGSQFLNKLFGGKAEDYKDMSLIILGKIEKGKQELLKLEL